MTVKSTLRFLTTEMTVAIFMFLIIVGIGYLISSLLSLSINFEAWNFLSKIVMVLSSLYAICSLFYNFSKVKNDYRNFKIKVNWLQSLYDDVRRSTHTATKNQKYAILWQCMKMKDRTRGMIDKSMFRIADQLEVVMSKGMNIDTKSVRIFFKNKEREYDMNILSTISTNKELKDFIVRFFHIYIESSSNTFDFDDDREYSFSLIANLYRQIEERLGVTKEYERELITNYYSRYED